MQIATPTAGYEGRVPNALIIRTTAVEKLTCVDGLTTSAAAGPSNNATSKRSEPVALRSPPVGSSDSQLGVELILLFAVRRTALLLESREKAARRPQHRSFHRVGRRDQYIAAVLPPLNVRHQRDLAIEVNCDDGV